MSKQRSKKSSRKAPKKKKSTKKKSPKKTTKKKKPRISKHFKPENMELEEWQRVLRHQFGVKQDFKLVNIGEGKFFSEYSLTNPQSEKTYKISIRGEDPHDNFCTCPDYRINYLGTCKHIEFTLHKLKNKRGAKTAFKKGCSLPFSEVYLQYGLRREVKFRRGEGCSDTILSLVDEFFDETNTLRETHLLNFHQFLNRLPHHSSHEVRCHDDVMAFIAEHQDQAHRNLVVDRKLKRGTGSPLFKNLLQTEMYPYQKEGALFAVKAGRSMIGDDMGLGKTVQALATAELLARLFHIERVLVISPASLKYQWESEIENFCSRSTQVIEGLNHQRRELYREDSFYKIVNYELVYRDLEEIQSWNPDLIVLDEAQRIKNWKTRTAQSVKQLDSTFALVLTGTPIENRIEELHSIMEFIDQRHFGPLYRFVQKHRIVDGGGKVVGYKDLQELRESLKTVFIRRKKSEVLQQLPERRDKNLFVPMTPEQNVIHDEHREIVARLVAKWRRYKFLCEADQRRLQIALNYMRMAADNTYLVDKSTVHGPKIEELATVLQDLVVEGEEKVVIFTQWLKMAELIEDILVDLGIEYAYLNGSVPTKKRKKLISRFQEDDGCRIFLSTDAGGVGLNLQSGSAVINMDLPWNPAVLEQRIGRVHRLGQKRKVQVINFISSASIESRIMELLKFKKSLFVGALDDEGDNVVMVGESQVKSFVKTVEVVIDEVEKYDPNREQQNQEEIARDEIRAKTEESGGESTPTGTAKETEQLTNLLDLGSQLLQNLSRSLVQSQGSGKTELTSLIDRDPKSGETYFKVPLPEKEVVKNAFASLGELIARSM